MEKGLGIDGLSLRSADPAAPALGYRTPLGLDADAAPRMRQGGPSAVAALAGGSDYFPADRRAMPGIRARGLHARAAQVEAGGIGVQSRPERDGGIGGFARLPDPEGAPIAHRQPPG